MNEVHTPVWRWDSPPSVPNHIPPSGPTATDVTAAWSRPSFLRKEVHRPSAKRLTPPEVETHNSPSAIEPYGGAMTGSGGIFRDILGTGQGAAVSASTDVFCFAPPDLPAEEVPCVILGRTIPERELRLHSANAALLRTPRGSCRRRGPRRCGG